MNNYGILLIDKPAGLTSHDVVMRARKVLKTKKIGHTGTLDPFATGLLVLCVGRATKLVGDLSVAEKEYEAKVILGLQTDTDDITGKPLKMAEVESIKDQEIRSVLNSFIGRSQQVPPAYSAIKVNGRKLYEYARQNAIMPELKPREIDIKSINKVAIDRDESGQRIDVDFTCLVSKGTYIRAIARDMGEKLGSAGTLGALRRTKVGMVQVEEASTLEDFEKGQYTLCDPIRFLDLPKVVLSPELIGFVESGRPLSSELFMTLTDTIIYDEKGQLVAIYRYDKEKEQMRMSVKIQ